MKARLCLEIAKNFGRLLSVGFWKQAVTNPGFHAWFFIRLIIAGALLDIVLLVFCPGYPEEAPK